MFGARKLVAPLVPRQRQLVPCSQALLLASSFQSKEVLLQDLGSIYQTCADFSAKLQDLKWHYVTMFKFLNQIVSTGNQTSDMSCVTKAGAYPKYLDICELVLHLQHVLGAS